MDSTPHLRTANLVIVAVGLALSTSCLMMRIYTKTFVMKSFWWDDVFIIAAWLFTIGIQATLLYGFDHAGLGLHITELSILDIGNLKKTVLAAAIIYVPCLALAKLALLMLFYRLLNSVRAWVYTLYLVGFVIIGYSIALTLALIFACDPIAKSWSATISGGSCVNLPGLYLATAATNTASDLVLIVIPIQVLWKLQMRFAEKLGAIFVFGIGCLTAIMSILRLATLWPLVTSEDFSYKLALASTFVNIEANFIIICGSLPYLRQLMRHYAPRWFPNSNTRDSASISNPSDSMTRSMQNPRVDSTLEEIENSDCYP